MEESIEVGNMELPSRIAEVFHLQASDPAQLSPLTLAYIGDGIFDLVIRTLIVKKGNAPVNRLHKKVSEIVKAPAQAEMLHVLEPMLTEEEQAVYKRGRNAKSFTSAKNASIGEYRTATGLEALMGYLYLTGNVTRILELIQAGLQKL